MFRKKRNGRHFKKDPNKTLRNKTIMSEIKITPNRIKSRVDTTEEIVNKHETQSNKNYPT